MYPLVVCHQLTDQKIRIGRSTGQTGGNFFPVMFIRFVNPL